MNAKYLIGAVCVSAGFAFVSCSDDNDYSAATGNIVSVVETGDAAVTATTAVVNGTVLDLSQYASASYDVGVIYGTANDPTTTGKKQSGTLDSYGNVTTTLSELTKGQRYYYATYVTLQGRVTSFGDIKSFYTTDVAIDATAAGVTATKANLTGTVDQSASVINAGASEIEYGFKVAASEDAILTGDDYPATGAETTFSQAVAGLLPGQTYYYAAYFKIGDGMVFSETKSFTTEKQAMEYVDLGLSVLWAKYNLGAESETEAGGLYGYGDITGMNRSEYAAQYATGDIAGTENDIAAALSAVIDAAEGVTQKSAMPTTAQIDELFANTTQEFTSVDGVNGYKFTGKNGNSIFFPVAGYRNATNVEETGNGYYWIGNINPTNGDYGQTLLLADGNVSKGTSARQLGLSVRSVRPRELVKTLDVDNSKIVLGDLENNGRLRIEVYNAYGSTSANPPINLNDLKFGQNMVVTFTLSGLPYDANAEGSTINCMGGLEFADADWSAQYWSSFNSKYDCRVTGNGTYTVWMEGSAEGAMVFCIDIDGLHNAIGDEALANVKATIDKIEFDVKEADMSYYVDNSKVLFGNKDGDGVNGRIEIYNAYGSTPGLGVNVDDLDFNGFMAITFSISGIDGNLISGASKSYKTELSFAAASWSPSYWGGTDFAAATVTGDGTYTVFAPLCGQSLGAVVWTIELYDLWKELVDPSLVKATIDNITIAGKKR